MAGGAANDGQVRVELADCVAGPDDTPGTGHAAGVTRAALRATQAGTEPVTL